jgi:predicted DNA-binding ribbon-helix-helix protein
MTQVSVPETLFASLKELALSRDCSVNRLINSAVLAYYQQQRSAN